MTDNPVCHQARPQEVSLDNLAPLVQADISTERQWVEKLIS